MYAVVRQGGHQYRVTPGDILQVEKIEVDPGEEISLEDVLMVSNGDTVEIGEPRVSGAVVKARIRRLGRGKKIKVYKFKRRKGYQKMYGHRQPFTEIEITAIEKDGKALS